MKLFDKPWLEIIKLDMLDVLTQSPLPDEGDPSISDDDEGFLG